LKDDIKDFFEKRTQQLAIKYKKILKLIYSR